MFAVAIMILPSLTQAEEFTETRIIPMRKASMQYGQLIVSPIGFTEITRVDLRNVQVVYDFEITHKKTPRDQEGWGATYYKAMIHSIHRSHAKNMTVYVDTATARDRWEEKITEAIKGFYEPHQVFLEVIE